MKNSSRICSRFSIFNNFSRKTLSKASKRVSFGVRPSDEFSRENKTATFAASNPSDTVLSPFGSTDNEAILKLAYLQKPKADETETFFILLPIPIGVFWRRFLADNSIYSCREFYAEEGHSEIDMEKWEPDYK
jgi:hypothetical protein